MFVRILMACAVFGMMAGVSLADEKAEKKAREAVDQFIAKAKGPEGTVTSVTDAPVKRAFPDQYFFVLRYRQYPVAIAPPEPLMSNNVFIVKADGKLEHFTDTKSLEKFFKAALAPATKEDQLKDAAQAWLRLAQEFPQDGGFEFSIPADSVKVAKGVVSGKAEVAPKGGNKGEITVEMTFDNAGKLTAIKEGGKVFPGPRPRCQATKLLDADPIVRAMAEEAILVMGSACKWYLDEQRAKASAELQLAIDRVWKRIQDECR